MNGILRYFLVPLICSFSYLFCAQNPEAQIVIIEDFITSEMAHALMQFHDSEKKDLSQHADNQVVFSASTDFHVRYLVSWIASRVLEVMRHHYPLSKHYEVDHCALYARLPGNSCVYHADNIAFSCPIHGRDQGQLRMTCSGECPGARFVPNHTPWREYTALVYLNDDFEGGEILFEDGPVNKLYRRVIPIKKNMLVLTPDGSDFYHEVFQVRSGKRYSLNFWFTSDPQYFNSVIKSSY